MNITVYTTSTCPFCNMLTTYLNDKNIEFTEKRVDEDKEAAKEMMSASGGFLGVPFTIIEKDGNRQNIIGFDQNKFDAILG